ncbi:ABC transporter permease [Streptomyces oceani]|uniref:ABC transmembrane type-1 domain-containing protein n=1 Tax=Streptomyces oceani TaxID=1075402 RepID=A0A1E7JVB7_9ACTN|nr:ABC transporter permease subunit [Streptomyces oceani]OEU94397.1 hypothetical protein AN216_24515 [Streptomyces oceani]
MGTFTAAWDWLTSGANWTGAGGAGQRLGEHLVLTVLSMGCAVLLALPLALWLGHVGRGGTLAINVSNVGRAVPTFAVLVLLALSPLGPYGELTTVIALVLFAIPPLLTNAYVGLREADRDVVEAARGMGMSGWQVLRRVELPLAFPLIMTGVRSATVQVVATATLAALAGGGGLGRIITAGFNTYDTAQVAAGAALVAALALVVEGVLVLLSKLTDPMRGRTRPGRGGGASTAGPSDGAGAGTDGEAADRPRKTADAV